jgi:hypothetical protein
MSEETSNLAETQIRRKGSHRCVYRRAIIIAIIACILTGSAVVVAFSPVKVSFTIVNVSSDEITVSVFVDNHEHKFALLEPNESVSWTWDLMGVVHRYDIWIGSPLKEVFRMHSWTYVLVPPFCERVIA